MNSYFTSKHINVLILSHYLSRGSTQKFDGSLYNRWWLSKRFKVHHPRLWWQYLFMWKKSYSQFQLHQMCFKWVFILWYFKIVIGRSKGKGDSSNAKQERTDCKECDIFVIIHMVQCIYFLSSFFSCKCVNEFSYF